jgi:hypothetical protein
MKNLQKVKIQIAGIHEEIARIVSSLEIIESIVDELRGEDRLPLRDGEASKTVSLTFTLPEMSIHGVDFNELSVSAMFTRTPVLDSEKSRAWVCDSVLFYSARGNVNDVKSDSLLAYFRSEPLVQSVLEAVRPALGKVSRVSVTLPLVGVGKKLYHGVESEYWLTLTNGNANFFVNGGASSAVAKPATSVLGVCPVIMVDE